MQKLSKIPVIVASLLASFSLVSVPALVYAQDANSGGSANAAEHSGRLADTKLKVCQRREKQIDNIMARIADRGQRQVNLFSSIATKVEDFATKNNKKPSNYDALVAAVNAAQANAQQTVDTVKNTSVTFKCDGSDPQGAAASFKTALKNEIAALKEYKTAVKNLIVGVKSVTGQTNSSNGGTQ